MERIQVCTGQREQLMQQNATTNENTAGIISILLIYVTLIILILVFAQQLLTEISRGTVLARFIFIPLAVILPLFLVLIVGYNIMRLVNQRKKGLPGSRFKVKLLIFFTFISILASIPQGILSISFIRITMNSWFSNQLYSALQGGLDIALDYNRNTVNNLAEFSKSELLPKLLQTHGETPSGLWDTLQSVYPQIDSIQLFDETGNTIYFRGEQQTYMEGIPKTSSSGMLPRVKIGTSSIIRSFSPVAITDSLGATREIRIVLSIVLPYKFDENAKNITDALQMFTQYFEFKNTFILALSVFYFLFSFPILLLSILTGFLLSDEITRPVVHLEDAIQRVISGDYSFRIMTRSGDELAILVNSFNTMISELEQSRTTLRQTEKVTAWQEIAQRMAHEIKNPLTPIKLAAERIQRASENNSPRLHKIIDSSVNSISEEVEHLTQLLGEFRDFARLPSPHFETTDIRQLILTVAKIYQPNYTHITVDSDYLQPIQVMVDVHQMNRVFANLIINSFEAIDAESGTISLNSDLVRKGHTHYCRIQIKDTGHGISREYEQKVFHPYFTTKSNGTGLGLPIVERIVSDHQGKIWFETEEQVGTTFYIDLPLEQKS